MALANNMWVSEIPVELSILSLPEQVLVARYYPGAYIVKLFPKKKGAHNWDQAMMNSGLRGNVSVEVLLYVTRLTTL